MNISYLFNTNRQNIGSLGTNLIYDRKANTRRFGVSIIYKIPSRNKLAQSENLIKENTSDNNSLIQ